MLFFLIALTVLILVCGPMFLASPGDRFPAALVTVYVLAHLWFVGGVIYVALHFITKHW